MKALLISSLHNPIHKVGDMMVENQAVDIDTEGFLKNLQDWCPQVAKQLAQQDNITLTVAHWEIIDLYKNYYQRHKVIPIMRIMAKVIAKQLGSEKATSTYLYQLFPLSPTLQVSRIGGLPKPPSCI